MRLVIDLQGAQGLSRGRGIGRFSRELALAMAREPRHHEPIILLNEAIPETAESLSDSFAGLLPRDNIRSWRGLTGCSYYSGSLVRRRASELIRAQVLAGLNADLIHVASMVEGAADDVTSLWPSSHSRLPIVSTFYDAIPLLRPNEYLGDPKLRNWYFRHLHELKHCIALLGISKSSRQEAIDHLGWDPEYTFNILAGFNAEMFQPVRIDADSRAALLTRLGLREGFILFVGAGDARKNDLGLIRAYATLPTGLQAAHQIVIVGSGNPAQLEAEAVSLGVQRSNFVLLPHVPDSILPSLYSICRCFAMPSKHEGFGLPALEAMACGAAVIASNKTSLPEVVGLAEALFDPNRTDDIADHLLRVLTDEAFHDRLVNHGLAQSTQFTWSASANRAWDALEMVHDRHPACVTTRPNSNLVPARKLTLAFVGPVSPDPSVPPNFVQDLLPILEKYYDISLVTSSGVVDDPTLAPVFPVVDEDTFVKVANHFDRIIYQVGDSESYAKIIGNLLPLYPGVVVLHASRLGKALQHLSSCSGGLDGLARVLFDSHGWPAVKVIAEQGQTAAVSRFPCLVPVFRHALGVMMRSANARAVVAQHMAAEAADMVRLVPTARSHRPHGSRADARLALGLAMDTPVIASFGDAAAKEGPIDVLEAWHAAFCSNPTALLVFVGQIPRGTADAVQSRAKELGVGAQVSQIERPDQELYRRWLEAIDIAVQLQADRCMQTGTIVDCMAAGVPVVTDFHPEAADFPQNTIKLLPEPASVSEIAAALAALWADPASRAAMSGAAAQHVHAAMSPALVGQAYRDSVEHYYASGKAALLREAMPNLPASDFQDAAQALAVSFGSPGPARLLLDVSHMSQSDFGTGIQRVIREVGARVLVDPGPSVVADLVRLDGTVLRYARRFAARVLSLPSYGLEDPPILAARGDTLVLTDIYSTINRAEVEELRRQRRLGARVVIVVYDLLPAQRPDWFHPEVAANFQRWLQQTLSIVDAALCISRVVAQELVAWLDKSSGDGSFARLRPLDIGWFHLGSDFRPAVEGHVQSAAVGAALQSASQRTTLLMVGTIEPRKGHAQALAAFEQLWAAEEEIGLTVVGKPGWLTEGLQERLRTHSEAGQRLHWLQQPGDEDLARLYAGCAGLLVASEGEGFGLPIVEAARCGLPVLARDIPVFREIAGDSVSWFSGLDATALALAIRNWCALAKVGQLPSIQNMTVLSWDDSTKAFLKPLQSGVWPMRWVPPERQPICPPDGTVVSAEV